MGNYEFVRDCTLANMLFQLSRRFKHRFVENLGIVQSLTVGPAEQDVFGLPCPRRPFRGELPPWHFRRTRIRSQFRNRLQRFEQTR